MTPSPRSTRPPWLRPQLIASWREISLIALVMVGLFVGGSAWSAAHGSSQRYIKTLMSDRHLLLDGAIEAALLALFLAFLHRRKWVPTDFKIRPSVRATLQAPLLLVIIFIANAIVVLASYAILFKLQAEFHHLSRFLTATSPQFTHHSIHLSWIVLIGAMILNAYFEELTCMGYLFNQLAAKLHPGHALFIIVLLRMLCHSYQGLVHMLGIGAVFLIFGLWYWRTRNLWTLILAHILLDVGSLGLIKLIYS